MSIVTAVAENKLDYDQKIADLAYTCSGCLACDSRCSIISAHPPQVNITDMIRLLRYEAVKRGLVPEGITKKIYDEVKKTGDLGHKNSLKLPDKIKNDKADTVSLPNVLIPGQRKIFLPLSSVTDQNRQSRFCILRKRLLRLDAL